MAEKPENNEVPQAPEAPKAAQESFDLTINDLAQLKAIIDVAAGRGAFKPGEMAAVGTVYNKLNGFLEQVAKQGQQTNG